MMLIAPSTLVALREMAAWTVGNRKRLRVIGNSMSPTLEPGDHVLIDPTISPAVGQMVVALHPVIGDQFVIKRVAAVAADGSVTVASDNPGEGTDSRKWGPLPAQSVLGTVSWVFGRPEAVGCDDGGQPPPLVR